MARMIQQIKAVSENVTLKIDIDGRNIEVGTEIGNTRHSQSFKDLNELLDYHTQLSDCIQTIANELNQRESVNLIVGKEK